MNEVQVFTNEEFGTVRTVEKDGTQWFVGVDVAKILGFKQANDMTKRLDEDEKGRTISPTLRGNQRVQIINESGLYHAIFISRKKEAKAFRRWVTSEVLPAIRKTGTYGTARKENTVLPAVKENIERQKIKAVRIEALQRLSDRHRFYDWRTSLLLDRMALAEMGIDISNLPPIDTIINGMTITAGNIAKKLGCSAYQIGVLANSFGLKSPENGFYITMDGKTIFRYYYSAIEKFKELVEEL